MECRSHSRGRAYRCLHCLRRGKTEVNSKSRLEGHIYKLHIPNESHPYWCKLCLFWCKSNEALEQHVKTYIRHRNVMLEKGVTDSTTYLTFSDNPYFVGEHDMETLSREASEAWWSGKRKEEGSTDILRKALLMAVPEVDADTVDHQYTAYPLCSPVPSSDGPTTPRVRGSPSSSFDEHLTAEYSRIVIETQQGTSLETQGGNLEQDLAPLDLRVKKQHAAEVEKELENGDSGVNDSANGAKAECNQDQSRADGEHQSRSTQRVRQSLKRYRDTDSDSSSSSSSSSVSSTKSACSRLEFTSILGKMIRKSANIVGEQVIANAKLINGLSKVVASLHSEVKALREEVKCLREEGRPREEKAMKTLKSPIKKPSDGAELPKIPKRSEAPRAPLREVSHDAKKPRRDRDPAKENRERHRERDRQLQRAYQQRHMGFYRGRSFYRR